jgi:AIPR protein
MSGGRKVMDRVSESMMNDFASEHGLTSLSEDKRFEHFTSFITVGNHYGGTFDTEDVLVGKAAGIDGIAVIINGALISDIESLTDLDSSGDFDVTFVFVQADRGAGFDAAKIGNFGFAVFDFFKETPTLPRTPEIAPVSAIMTEIYKQAVKFKRGNPACRLYFATTGTWTNDLVLEGRRQAVVNDLLGTNLFREVTFTPLGAEGIQRLYRQSKNAIEREFVFENRVTLPEVPGVDQAFLGFLPVPELRKIVTDDNGGMLSGLFYSNPRDWQDYNDVNAEIKDTLKSQDKSRFVLMNNGITIIARSVRPTGNKFVIGDYTIVNGCQTSHVLFEQADKDDGTVAVPVRLIGTQDEDVINDIIRATNRQTPVSEDQFFALQEFPKKLELFFESFDLPKKLYYERRHRQYARLALEKTRVIPQPIVIKAFASMFLQEPHRTTRNYTALKDKVGKDIFGKQHRMEPYYVAAFAWWKLEYLFRNSKLDPKYKPARFHILLAARIIGNPGPLPKFMNGKDIDTYCKPILATLWDATKSDDLIFGAAELVDEAVSGNLDNDYIRTEPTTAKVIAKCIEATSASPKGG